MPKPKKVMKMGKKEPVKAMGKRQINKLGKAANSFFGKQISK